MTPEEQARRLVEEWRVAWGVPAPSGWGDLVRRLVPVFERGAEHEQYVAFHEAFADECSAKLEHAEAIAMGAEARSEQLRAKLERAKASVARLKKALLRNGRHDSGCPALIDLATAVAWGTTPRKGYACTCEYGAALAATEPGRPAEEKP